MTVHVSVYSSDLIITSLSGNSYFIEKEKQKWEQKHAQRCAKQDLFMSNLKKEKDCEIQMVMQKNNKMMAERMKTMEEKMKQDKDDEIQMIMLQNSKMMEENNKMIEEKMKQEKKERDRKIETLTDDVCSIQMHFRPIVLSAFLEHILQQMRIPQTQDSGM